MPSQDEIHLENLRKYVNRKLTGTPLECRLAQDISVDILTRLLIDARNLGYIPDTALDKFREEKTQTDFPIENRMDAMLSCVNNEIKQSVIISFQEKSVTPEDLTREFSTKVFAPTSIVARSILNLSFVPYGLAIRENFKTSGQQNTRVIYTLTSEGEDYAQPLAAFSLKHAVDNNYSLGRIFDRYVGKQIGLSHTMFAVIDSIVGGKRSIEDIARNANVSDVQIKNYLSRLQREKFVYVPKYSAEKSPTYTWAMGKRARDVQTVHNRKRETGFVADWISKSGQATQQQLLHIQPDMHQANISRVLKGLEEQGFIKTQDTDIRIKVNPKFAVIEFWADKFRYAAEDGAGYDKMHSILERFRKHPNERKEYIKKGLRRYITSRPYVRSS